MHIEPGVVDGAKIILSIGTAALSFGLAACMVGDDLKNGAVLPALALRSVLATAAVFTFFQILPHHPVGVSEVHLILGSTLFLVLGAGPAAIGLALGLLVQGLFFAPSDLPQYMMNVTTLLVPLWGARLLSQKIIPDNRRYADLGYGQVFALSAAYQGGIVAWVAFWALYGHGFAAQNLAAIMSFGAAYMLVVLIEPLVDLAVLAVAKTLARADSGNLVLNARVMRAAA
jgi:hypothetical protein